MKMTKYIIIILTSSVMLMLSSCFEPVPEEFVTEDSLLSIEDYLDSIGKDKYSSFIEVMNSTGMDNTLSAYNPNGSKYTLFMPSNQAFEDFFQTNENYDSMEELLADKFYVNALIRYHIVNRRIVSNDFPLGALPDSCLTGDYLTISYIQGEDSTYYKVNNIALVEREDLDMTNGVIHVLDHVLEPIVETGYEWLRANEDYQIIADLFEVTGLVDTMGLFITSDAGFIVNNKYTILAEPDSIYNADGISSVDDLKTRYSPDQTDYTDVENGLYQFAAYHIMDGSKFLADLYSGTNNYNSYAAYPLQISLGSEILVNAGVENFDSTYIPSDSSYSYVDYIEVFVNESNVQTRNGAIHFINQVMELFQPSKSRQTFQFYEDPVIALIRNEVGTYMFNRQELFSKIKWSGVEEMYWIKKSSDSEKAVNKDYIEVDGDFTITYTVPKILPGAYGMQIQANADKSTNATILVFLDGKQVGGNIMLTTGGANSSNPYRRKNVAEVEFYEYKEHTVTIKSLIPGRFSWDFVRFESDLKIYRNNNQ